jgi:hypothetical protein
LNPKKDYVRKIKERCEIAEDMVVDEKKGLWDLVKKVLSHG